MANYNSIIIRPLFTEKMSQLEEIERKYAFQVKSSANKIVIKSYLSLINKFSKSVNASFLYSTK